MANKFGRSSSENILLLQSRCNNNNNNNNNNSNSNNNNKKKNQVIYIMKEHVHKFSRSIYGNNWELGGYTFCGFV